MFELRPCKYCKHAVAHSAKTCPGCGGKNPYSFSLKEIGCATILLIAIVIGISVYNRVPSKMTDSTVSRELPETNGDPLPDLPTTSHRAPTHIDAWHEAIDLVRRGLTSPSTAKFPNYTEEGVLVELLEVVEDPGGGSEKFYSYRVSGFVDAQNALGGTVRQSFRVTLWTDGTKWLLGDSIEFD